MGARLMFILCFLFKASLGMIIENHPYKSSYWIFSMFLFDDGKVDVDDTEVLDILSEVMDILDIRYILMMGKLMVMIQRYWIFVCYCPP